ncbi:MAG: hypothetical protein MUP33_13120, partial [Polaromonas sp.]|nr:hypothetical protein [Polaromonas sp.]
EERRVTTTENVAGATLIHITSLEIPSQSQNSSCQRLFGSKPLGAVIEPLARESEIPALTAAAHGHLVVFRAPAERSAAATCPGQG